MFYVSEKRKNDIGFLQKSISIYADKSYENHIYSELFAESFSVEEPNLYIKDILKILEMGDD